MGKMKITFLLLLIFLSSSTRFSSVSAAPSSKIVNGVFSKAVSTLLKWAWSLAGSTKTAISGRPVLKFEEGYTVETVFDGSKLGIEPHSVEVLPTGEILVLDSANSNIYRVSSPLSRYSRPKLIAGSAEGYIGHVDGKPKEARLNHPKGFTVDDRGNIYIADAMNMAIRKIGLAGVTTIAGGKWGRGSVDGPSEDARFSNDFDLVYVGSSCSLLVIDRGNQAIREIQLHYDDCASQYDPGFPFGIAVLVVAGFCGYILAFLQRRASTTVSSQNDMNSRKKYSSPYQQPPLKSSGKPSLIAAYDEQVQQESFSVSLGRLLLNTGTSLLEIVGGIFGFKRKPLIHQMQHQYRQQQKHSDGWPLQDSYVIPDEDEPPAVEATTPTPKKTYAFMAKDPQKINLIRQSRAHYNGWDGDTQKQRQEKQHHYHQHYPSRPQTFYKKSCESTREIIVGTVQQLEDDQPHAELIKRLFHEDSK